MTDQDFLQQFEACTLPKEYFKHRGHLRISWLYLGKHTYPEAITAIRDGIKRYAASLGASQIYHETMTLAWVSLVAGAMKKKDFAAFDDFIAAHSALANSQFIYEYYSPDLLKSDAAKIGQIAPDLKPLPVEIHQFRATDR